jgi:hypothetical protein
MVHPILLIRRHIIPYELLDHWIHPLGLSIRLGREELNVILWTMLGFSLQKIMWLHATHRKQFLMIGLRKTTLGFASCIVLWLCW